MKTLSVTDTRNRLLEIVDQIEREPSTVVAVSKRGKPVMTLISTDVYESLVETLEIISEPKTFAQLRKSIEEARKRDTIPWKKVKAELGLQG